MRSTTRMLITIGVSGARLALPAAGGADPGKGKGKGQAKANKGKGESQRCAKTPKVGYSVQGTLGSFTADNAATPAFDGALVITVTGANSHARNSGDIADQNATEEGVQVAGANYTVQAGDSYVVTLEGFEGTDTPSPGDEVHIIGKIARTKKKCASSETSTADRYGTVDVRKVVITDKDADV